MSPTSNRVLALTQVAPREVVDAPRIDRLGVPTEPFGTVPRENLNQSLTEAATAAITVVRAPSGSGKTTGVAAWAAELTTVDAVIWLQADALAHDVHRFWRRLRSELVSSGAGPLPTLPQPDCDDAVWSGWISTTARALGEVGRRWLIVLDDFPVGSSCRLGDHLVWLASRSMGCLQVVITASGAPAIDLRTIEADGRCARIGPERLAMDEHEVAAVLAVRGVCASPDAVSFVTAHTFGWARGVGLAAHLLGSAAGDKSSTAGDPGAVAGTRPQVAGTLSDLDGALDSLVDREVLLALPPAGRELVIRTSVAAEVTPELARAVLGTDQPLTATPVECRKGFIDQDPGGTLRCHPLLRRSARRRLDTDWPILARAACRSAAEWHLTGGRDTEGVALAAGVDDPVWLARLLVESLAVPLIATDHAELLPRDALRWAEVERAEPLILAATATARGDLTGAEALLDQSRVEAEGAGISADPVGRLTSAMIRVAVAGQRADHTGGLAALDHSRRLLAEIGPTARTAKLAAVLDFHQAAFLASRGDLESALTVLAVAADVTQAVLAESRTVADEVGLSAWLHAIRGDLTVAARQATAVLTARTADRDEVGVGYAQLAAAWVHLERRELDQARQRLDHAMQVDTRHRDPWLVTGRCLTEARLATAAGDPDVALRLLAAVPQRSGAAASGWLADRLTLARAEAHLLAGEHQRALSALTPEPRQSIVEARALAAAARRAVGDRRGAQALLAGVDGQVAAAPLPAAVRVWALGAQLAAEAGDSLRARSLLERALRAAERETLRLALSSIGPWLSAFLDRDPELRRRHRSLVESIRRVREPAVVVPIDSARPAADVLVPLTERELQVLERLAQLCTTEEIAAELYVSANTVKTHIKSVFLKLAVNRRSDAVRQGRRLGLC